MSCLVTSRPIAFPATAAPKGTIRFTMLRVEMANFTLDRAIITRSRFKTEMKLKSSKSSRGKPATEGGFTARKGLMD